MPKQPNEILTSLELAGAYLQQVRHQLIRCDSLTNQTEPTLQRVAGLLETLKSRSGKNLDQKADRYAVLQLLTAVRVHAARAQMLLDTAAAFHCGAALAVPASFETYSPDGSWQAIYPNDQICLKA